MNKLYTYRGWILGMLGISLVLCNPFPVLSTAFPLNNLPAEILAQFIVAFVLLSLSVLLRVQARRSIGEHTRGLTHDADRLVTEGAYSRIRHPLYVSNTGVGLSFIILHLGFNLMAIPFAVILVAFEILLSKMEDRYLENRFGDEWRKWTAVTPAFLPWLTLGNKTAVNQPTEKVIEKNAASFQNEMKNKVPAKRSFLTAFRADFSTWLWLAVVIALVVLRKTILNFNLMTLLG